MSKLVKVVALIAIAAVVIIYAAPIAGALAGLGAGVASGAAIAAVTSAVIGVGISLALTAVGTLFAKGPQSVSQSMADRLQATVVPSAPRRIVFGTTAGGNDIRFYETFGSKKDAYAQVIALASHRLSAIKSFYCDADLTWSNGSLVAHTDGISGFRAITEGNASNAAPLGSGAYWTSSATFTGCAYLAITWKLDTKAWPQNIPTKLTTVVDGCPLYDPRLDSTNGGSGPHRIADQSTWAFTNGGVEIGRNPALAMLAYLLGWRVNGKLMWGMGIPPSRINFDNFRLYANVCEERVQLAGGGTSQRYFCDGIFSTADTHESVIAAISASMGSCKLSDVGGLYGFIGGYDDTLGPKQALGDDDLVAAVGSASPYSWVPAGPTRETYNIVRGRYADPTQQYQLVDWGVIESDPLPDGVNRTLTLDLGCVSDPKAAQRIAKQFVAREALTPGYFQATFGPRAFAVNVGSLVTLSVNSLGWNNKLFRVMEQHEVHNMLFTMTLREESSEVYVWDKEEKALPASIRPAGYDPTFLVMPTGLSLSSVTYGSI
jgi:hypothetical protein